MTNEIDNSNLRKVYQAMPESGPPHPWKSVKIHVGGVIAVGFAANSELLLVLTHSGRGVVDCATGEVVARCVDIEDDGGDPHPISLMGIGPLSGQRIHLAGLWGGGLRLMTCDGWVAHRAAPNWPGESAMLCPPHAAELSDDPSAVTMLVKDADVPIRAIGFSDSGCSLVVATTKLFVWIRG